MLLTHARLAFLMLAVAGGTRASAQAALPALDVDGDPNCLNAPALLERVAHYSAPNAPDARQLRITLHGRERAAELELRRDEVLVARRRFTNLPESCSDRRDALALSIALAVEHALATDPAAVSGEGERAGAAPVGESRSGTSRGQTNAVLPPSAANDRASRAQPTAASDSSTITPDAPAPSGRSELPPSPVPRAATDPDTAMPGPARAATERYGGTAGPPRAALDPGFATPGAPRTSTNPDATPGEPRAVSDPDSATLGAPRAATGHTDAAPAPSADDPLHASGLAWNVAAGGRWLVQTLPSPVLAASAGLELQFSPSASLELAGLVSGLAETRFAMATARTQLVGGEALGCRAVRFASFAAQGCMGASAAAYLAHGRGYYQSLGTTLFWAALLGRVALRWPHSGPLALRASLQALVHVRQPELRVDGVAERLGMGTFGGSLGLDMIVALQ